MAVTRLGLGGYAVASAGGQVVKVFGETVNLNETLSVSLQLVRLVSEVEQIVEGLVSARTLARVVSEVEQIVEGLVGTEALNRVVNEVERIVEALVAARVRVVAVAEIVHLNEARNQLVTIIRSIVESLNLTELVNRTSLLTRAVNETVDIIDGVFRSIATDVTRVVTETVQVVENAIRVVTPEITRVINEVARVIETLSTFRPLIRLTSETVSVCQPNPPITAGLVVHLDASQLGLADGAAVTTWPNLGTGPQPTIVGTPAPVFKTGMTTSGGPVVRFTAGQGRLRGTHGINESYTIAYVVRAWGSTHGRAFAAQNPPSNFLVGFHSTVQDAMYDSSWLNVGVPYGTPPGPWKLYEADGITSVRSRFFINGVLSGSINTPNGMGGTYALSGFDPATASETMDCEVAELLIYDHPLSATERTTVEQYLTGKWLGTLPVSTGAVVVLGLNRFFSGTVNIGETLSLTGYLLRWANEMVQIGEGIVRTSLLTRAINETVRVIETVLRVRALNRLISETVQIGEAKELVVGLYKAINEVVRVSEDMLAAMGLTRLYIELVAITESFLTSRARVQAKTETVEVSETTGLARLINRIIDATVTVVEVLFPSRQLVRPRDETVEIDEDTLVSRSLVREVADLLYIEEFVNLFASIPSLVCSCINLYAYYAGQSAIAPSILGGATDIGPEIEDDRGYLYAAVDGATGIDPLLEALRTKIDPALEAQLAIEECEDCP